MFAATALLGTALCAAPYGVPVPGTNDVPDGLRVEMRQKQVRDLARIEADLAFVRSMIDISREWAGATTAQPASPDARVHIARWKEQEAELTAAKRKLIRAWVR